MPSRSRTTVPSATGTSRSFPLRPCLPLPWPWTPEVAPAVRVVLERKQRSDVVVDRQPDVTASAAVAPIRPTSGDVGLPAKRHCARAAVPGLYVDLALVNEHKRPLAAL